MSFGKRFVPNHKRRGDRFAGRGPVDVVHIGGETRALSRGHDPLIAERVLSRAWGGRHVQAAHGPEDPTSV